MAVITARQPATQATATARLQRIRRPADGTGEALSKAKASPRMVASASSSPSGINPEAGARRCEKGTGAGRCPAGAGTGVGDDAVSEVDATGPLSGEMLNRTNWRSPGPGAELEEASARSSPDGVANWRTSVGLSRSIREPRPFPKTRLDTREGSVTRRHQCKSTIFTDERPRSPGSCPPRAERWRDGFRRAASRRRDRRGTWVRAR